MRPPAVRVHLNGPLDGVVDGIVVDCFAGGGGASTDFEYEGAPLTKTAQVRMVGNSVSPPVARALVAAQIGAGSARRAA